MPRTSTLTGQHHAASGGAVIAGHGIVINPPPQALLGTLASPPQLSEAQRLFRTQLGLPVDRPIVMSGHQATLWHAGIAAKWFAMEALAQARSAAPAWLIVDHDEERSDVFAYPTADLRTALARGGPAPTGEDLSPRGAGALRDLAWIDADAPHPAITGRLGSLRDAVRTTSDAPGMAMQSFAIAGRVLSEAGCDPRAVTPVLATSIAHTALFERIVRAIGEDPLACVRAYNAAAARHPGAGLRPLAIDGDSAELPLWRLAPGAPRVRITSRTLASVPVAQLAPTALLLTGLLRLAACELFIHGLGGGAYDPAADDWFRAWPAPTRAAGTETPAPSAVVSATLLLPIAREAEHLPDHAAAAWKAHAARHQPGLVGDDARGRRREELLHAIRTARAQGADPAHAFRALHALLEEHRAANAAALSALSREAELAGETRHRRAVALSRTWPVALHEPAALAGLRASVRSAFGV